MRAGRAGFALHLELFTVRRAPGKLKYLAGCESGMGAFANDIVPEAAASRASARCGCTGSARPQRRRLAGALQQQSERRAHVEPATRPPARDRRPPACARKPRGHGGA